MSDYKGLWKWEIGNVHNERNYDGPGQTVLNLTEIYFASDPPF